MFTTLSVNVATGIIVVLFTSWTIWRKREKLRLSYTITESDLFPFHDGQGKYYAIKISNNGAKLIKNIIADITISEGEIDKVTTHELIQNLTLDKGKVKFTIETLNPKEDVNFVITSKANELSKLIVKIRGEGANADVKSADTPSKRDLVGTAMVWGVIGFVGCIVLANGLAEDNPIDNRMDNIFGSLNRAGIPHVFHKIVENHGEITYEGTSFYLMGCYLKDPVNKNKYVAALKNIASVEHIAENSKGVAYYMIYKIDTKANCKMEANYYLDKCKEECPTIYKFLLDQDQYYNLDVVQAKWMELNEPNK